MTVLKFPTADRRAIVSTDRLRRHTIDELRQIHNSEGESAAITAAERILVTVAAILGRVAGSDRLGRALGGITEVWDLP